MTNLYALVLGAGLDLLFGVSSFLLHLDGRNAWRIFRRDRYAHKSPNSAQSETVCVGVLNIHLGGSSYYGGTLVEKTTIGDNDRPVAAEDSVPHYGEMI